jgi:hypothetical protein
MYFVCNCMNHSKIIPIILVFMVLSNKSKAQTILQQNFNDTSFYRSWKVSENIEHAYKLGVNETRYVRFHPKFQNEYIQTPDFTIPNSDVYALIFDWNQAENNTADSVKIQMTQNNGATWRNLKTLLNGNNRIWLRDSVFLDSLNINENIAIRWQYFSTKEYPSQYFNLDNVLIKTAGTVTSVKQNNNQFEVKIFPNPATNKLMVECNNFVATSLQFRMYALNGTVLQNITLPVSKKNKVEIDVSELSGGIYFISIESKDEIFTKTFVVQ